VTGRGELSLDKLAYAMLTSRGWLSVQEEAEVDNHDAARLAARAGVAEPGPSYAVGDVVVASPYLGGRGI